MTVFRFLAAYTLAVAVLVLPGPASHGRVGGGALWDTSTAARTLMAVKENRTFSGNAESEEAAAMSAKRQGATKQIACTHAQYYLYCGF